MSFGRLRNRRSKRSVNRSSRIAEVLLQLLDVLERADDAAGADVFVYLAFAALPFGGPEPGLCGVDELLRNHDDLAVALLHIYQVALLKAKCIAHAFRNGYLVIAGHPDNCH